MPNEPINLYRDENNIRCFITNITRNDLSRVRELQESGYLLDDSRIGREGLRGVSISKVRTFDNEAEFRQEHERVVGIMMTLKQDAAVRSFYYRANEETPLFSADSAV